METDFYLLEFMTPETHSKVDQDVNKSRPELIPVKVNVMSEQMLISSTSSESVDLVQRCCVEILNGDRMIGRLRLL
jgi:hypothetical protein